MDWFHSNRKKLAVTDFSWIDSCKVAFYKPIIFLSFYFYFTFSKQNLVFFQSVINVKPELMLETEMNVFRAGNFIIGNQLNPDPLIWISNLDSFNFFLNSRFFALFYTPSRFRPILKARKISNFTRLVIGCSGFCKLN